MKPEIEAKFLDVDHDTLRVKLRDAGAECVQPMRLTKRKNYDYPDWRLDRDKHAWVRVRDSGNKITLDYKQLDNREFDGTKEVSIKIDSVEAADAFLQAIGLVQVNYQETRRESWRLGECEIELDEWPWIKPFLEIEGPDEQAVKGCAAKLGLDWSQACHGSVEVAYRAEYDVSDEDIDRAPLITFDTAVPEAFEQKRKS